MKKLILSLAIGLLSLPTLAAQQWNDETELGSTIVSGNTSTETYNAGDKTSYQFDQNIFKFSGRYLQSKANGLESAKNWDASLRYERELDASFAVFASFGLSSDIYSGYVQRNDFDLGGKYFLSKSTDTNWSVEAGYRNSFTQFTTASPNPQANYVRIYSEATQVITEGITGKLWVEYLPNLTDTDSYLLNAEPSVSIMLNKLLSLKGADLFKYTNTLPKGFSKHLDSFFTLSIVAKF